MANIVYVHAQTKDAAILRKLVGFYGEVKGALPSGLERIERVLSQRQLEDLLAAQPEEFRAAIAECTEGVGIWTEWASAEAIDLFYQGSLHKTFSAFGLSTLEHAQYRVIQLRDGSVSQMEISKQSIGT